MRFGGAVVTVARCSHADVKNLRAPRHKFPMQTFPQFLAAALVKGTLRKFSRLHADYLQQEQQIMSTTTDQTSNPTLNQGASSGAPARVGVDKLVSAEQSNRPVTAVTVGSQVNVGQIKQVGHKSYEGSNAGEHRGHTADAHLPNNPGPREQK